MFNQWVEFRRLSLKEGRQSTSRRSCESSIKTSCPYLLLAPDDYGLAPLAAVHTQAYLDYLSSAYQQWH